MIKRVSLAILAAAVVIPANAQTTSATGFITYSQVGSSYNYDITIHNTGTTSIDALWYSWIPGYDFMTVLPTNMSGPAGWTETATRDSSPFLGAGDGYSVQYTGGTLAAGATLGGFLFTSTETPAQLAATSPIFPVPTGESYVYSGAVEQSSFGTLIINPVPEPVTALALAPALLLMLRRKRS